MALLLARHKLRVAIVERARLPRYKVCGGCLNARGLSVLEGVGLAHLAGPPRGVPLGGVTFYRGSRQVSISGRLGAVVDRETFDAALTDAAREAGATVIDGTMASVRPGIVNGRRIVALTRDGHCVGELAARFVVAAGGLADASLRELPEFAAKVERHSRFGFGVASSDRLESSGYPEGQLVMAIAGDGYMGVSRLANGRLAIAAAADPHVIRGGTRLGEWLAAALRACRLPEISGLETAEIKGAPPLTRTSGCAASERAAVLGDAAGYVEPITGEGMGCALAAAARLAPLAEAASRAWRPSMAKAWRRELRRTVYRRQGVNRLLARALRRRSTSQLLFAAAGAAHAHRFGRAPP